MYVDSIAWTRDGSVLVYDDSVPWLAHLWRLEVAGSRPPERMEVAGVGAAAPAMALSRDRLAFTRVSADDDIYRFEVGRPVQLVVGSTFREMEPRFSPDGQHVAFGSARSGSGIPDIWVSQADGSNPQQLTHGPGQAGLPFLVT